MLIYDHNKEFIGIDKESLNLLGYERFEDLIHEHKDIAELFVKKPGFIHNFTNFPWIDFVLHAQSEEAKVIIAGKTKAFTATIDIIPLSLKQAPGEEAFLINLKNVQNYKLDASEQPEPAAAPFDLDTKEFNTPSPATPEPISSPEPTVYVEPEPVHQEVQSQEPITFDDDVFVQSDDTPLSASTLNEDLPVSPPAMDEEELDIFFHDDEAAQEPAAEPAQAFVEATPSFTDSQETPAPNKPAEKAAPMLGAYLSDEDKAYLADLKYSDDYVYDPQIAADELGLPVDLIEEFIGDFIKQAHEFKEQLFVAIGNEDFDNIKVLSHKLKGVAANLRIEDSFEVLRNVNETADIKECEANLKKFYLTIAKLEGKDIEEAKQELEQPVVKELYDLTPKFEPVPQEETVQPLNISELDETESASEPVMLDSTTPNVEQRTTTADGNDDIYDFGLIAEESNEPLIVQDNEDEIKMDIENFDIPDSDETISEPQEVETDKEELSEEAPLLTFDINTASAEIGLSPDLVSALIDDYILEANEMKNKLNDVVAASDVVRWKGYATQLKGVSDNLRITEISDVLQNLISSSEPTQAKAAIQKFYGFINQL